MKQAEMEQRLVLRAVAVAAALCAVGAAQAVEIDTGNPDLSVRFDNTVKYNYGYRVASQDPAILKSVNSDDGDRNFDKGTVTNRVDLLSEFDFVFKKRFGFRVSGAAWADGAYSNLDNNSVATSNVLLNGKQAVGLSSTAQRYGKGPSGEVLDAFLFGGFDVGDTLVNIKAGQHTLYWGESLLNPIHGISFGQSAIDVGKLVTVPGVEAKEVFLPRMALSTNIQPSPTFSLAAQYFLDWKPARLAQGGTFLSKDDMLQGMDQALIVGGGKLAARAPDIEIKKNGDWGVAARWTPDWLDGTIGGYYRKTTDILPQVYVTPAVAALPAATCSALGKTALAANTCLVNPAAATVPQILSGVVGNFSPAYGRDIDVFGVSLSKNVAGIAVGADLSYRKNMPLFSEAVTVLPVGLANPALGQISIADAASGQLGYARGDTIHGVLNFLGNDAKRPIYDALSYLVEFSWNRLASVTQGQANYKGRDSYTGIDKSSKDFIGVGINVTPTWFQVLPGVDLSMPLTYAVGLKGNSAVVNGGNKGTGQYSLGLSADVKNKYKIDLKYVNFMGNYATNPATGGITSNAGGNALLTDRGFVALTLKTTF